ncbi:MAG: hypothetical protein ACTHVE_10000 [Senegalia sp. (in: firmicutes)]|uniref:hypothetical protein n=1 Tax=Senegalia sp. (in: firmicutes) TaxID=1924098 RepID=UPI003F95EADF
MHNENTFNKEKFKDLLESAKGDRSINKYANDSGVSAAHISRLLRKLINTPPSPEIIHKLTSTAYNDISYRDMMEAAGHIVTSQNFSNNLVKENNESYNAFYQIEKKSYKEKISQKKKLKQIFLQIILSYLYEMPYEWSIHKTDNNLISDMVIKIEDYEYDRQSIIFQPTLKENLIPLLQVYQLYGRLSTIEFDTKEKVIIAVNSQKYYNYFKKNIPISLKINLYIMLIDIENHEVIKEEKIANYN